MLTNNWNPLLRAFLQINLSTLPLQNTETEEHIFVRDSSVRPRYPCTKSRLNLLCPTKLVVHSITSVRNATHVLVHSRFTHKFFGTP